MRWTFRKGTPMFTIVTSLRTFTIVARDIATARENAPGHIIPNVEQIMEVRA